MTLHPLLVDQIAQAKAQSSDGTLDLQALLAAVHQTYERVEQTYSLTGEGVGAPDQAVSRFHASGAVNLLGLRGADGEDESRFRDLAGSASDWFWETDPSNRLIFLSCRAAEVMGRETDSLIGQDRFQVGLCGRSEEEQRHHCDLLRQKRPFRNLICSLRHPSRGDQVVRLSGKPVFDKAGEFSGYRGTGTDITREMEAVEQANMANSRFVQAIETVSDGFALFNADDVMTVCNTPFRTTFSFAEDLMKPGLSFDALLNRTAAEMDKADSLGIDGASWTAARLGRHVEASGVSFEHVLPDGRWIESRDFRTPDGGTLVVQSDITDAKTRQMALDNLRHRFELILQAVADGIIAFDASGAVSFVNRSASAMLGWRADEIMKSPAPHRLFLHSRPDGTPLPEDECFIHQAIVAAPRADQGESMFWRKDGGSFPVVYAVSPLEEEGVYSGMVLSFRDVTLRRRYESVLTDQQRRLELQVEQRTKTLQGEIAERKRIQAALAASQNRMRNIADNLFEGVLVVDPYGHIIEGNRSARRMLLGDPERRLAGSDLDDLVRLQVDRVPIAFMDSAFRTVVEEETVIRDDDAVFVRAQGETLQVAYACSPLYEDGRCLGAVLSFRDIAELKRAQLDALQASRLASVGQLAAGIAHEINTPIQYLGDNLRFFEQSITDLHTVLNAYGDLTRAVGEDPALSTALGSWQEKVTTACDDADVEFLLDEIPVAVKQSLDGVRQVTEIVRSMKEFSHPGTAHKVATDLNQALESTLTVSRNEWKHRAELELCLEPDLPMVFCLPGAINQVFLNLVINAADALSEAGDEARGVIRISTRSADDMVEITFSDNGPGVPEHLRERIFDPFFTTKDVGKGTGQGLMICKDVIVGKHGGKLYLDESRDQGATFVILLPILSPEGEDDAT